MRAASTVLPALSGVSSTYSPEPLATLAFCSEAFSALDVDTERAVRRALWRAFPRCTALVISHRGVGHDEADRVLVLRDGRFAERPAARAA